MNISLNLLTRSSSSVLRNHTALSVYRTAQRSFETYVGGHGEQAIRRQLLALSMQVKLKYGNSLLETTSELNIAGDSVRLINLKNDKHGKPDKIIIVFPKKEIQFELSPNTEGLINGTKNFSHDYVVTDYISKSLTAVGKALAKDECKIWLYVSKTTDPNFGVYSRSIEGHYKVVVQKNFLTSD